MALLPQAGQVPQPNVSDFGRGINGVRMPVSPNTPAPGSPLAPAPTGGFMGYSDQQWKNLGALSASQSTPAMPQSSQMYQNALAQARSGIQQSYVNAIADIQNSQKYAGQALGQLPGEIDRTYGQALGTLGSSLGTIGQGQAAAGLNGKAPAGIGTTGVAPSLQQYMAPVEAGIRGSQASAHANVPLLQAGIAQEGARQTALADQARLAATGQLDMQAAQFAQQEQQTREAQAFQERMAQQQQANTASPLQQFLYQRYNIEHPGPATPGSSAASPWIDPTTQMPQPFSATQLASSQTNPAYAALKTALRTPGAAPKAWADFLAKNGGNPALVYAGTQLFGSQGPPEPPPATNALSAATSTTNPNAMPAGPGGPAPEDVAAAKRDLSPAAFQDWLRRQYAS